MSTTTTERPAPATKTDRYIAGQVLQYNTPTPVNEGLEILLKGAFKESLNANFRIPLLVHHEKKAFPVGSMIAYRDQNTGLWAKFKMADTPEADGAYSLIADGHLSGASIGFLPDPRATAKVPLAGGGHRYTRWKGRLFEVSLVSTPAYENARVYVADAGTEPDDGPSTHCGPKDIAYYRRLLNEMSDSPVQRALDEMERAKDERRKQLIAELKEWSDTERLWETAKKMTGKGALEVTRRSLRAGKIRGSWDYD